MAKCQLCKVAIKRKMKQDIKKVMMDDLENVDSVTKAEYLELRHKWLEEVRKKDKKVLRSQRKRIYDFLNKEKIRQYKKKYNKRPDIKEKIRQYYQRPDIKEKTKQYQKQYHQRPDIKEKRKQQQKERYQRPDIKEKKRQYQKQYYQRPDIKEKKRQYQKQYHQRKKLKGK